MTDPTRVEPEISARAEAEILLRELRWPGKTILGTDVDKIMRFADSQRRQARAAIVEAVAAMRPPDSNIAPDSYHVVLSRVLSIVELAR